MNQKNQKTSVTTILVRVLCIVLAALMVAGMVAMIVQYSSFKVMGMSDAEYDDIKVRIGLMYGDDVTTSFELETDYGFVLGALDSNNDFEPLYTVSNTVVTAASDINLVKNGGGYVAAGESITIGSYQIKVNAEYPDEESQAAAVAAINTALNNGGIYSSLIYAFPAYDNGTRVIKIGDFQSEEGVEGYRSLVESVIGITCGMSVPTSASVMLLDPDNNKLVFEFDGTGSTSFGLCAVQKSKNSVDCIKTPADNIYSGVFEFRRYVTSAKRDGVALTNVLSLDEYIAGVLPWEITPTWHHELQKALCITARTFTLTHLNMHKSYGFDLCNSTHCQAYLGRGRLNENVQTAIDETRGMVVSYNGKITPVYYSAVFGGGSVSAEYAWGGTTYPYLVSQKTPWENYPIYLRGEWVYEVSPSELCDYLNSKGYSELRDEIKSINIDELAPDSTYIYQLTITDIHGNSVTVKKTDTIRILFSKYVYSANFVISKDGIIEDGLDHSTDDDDSGIVTLAGGWQTWPGWNPTVPDTDEDDADEDNKPAVPELPVITSKGESVYTGDKATSILTADGISKITDYSKVDLIGQNGQYVHNFESGTTSGGSGIGIVADIKSTIDMSLYNNPATANGNFYFIGKGWGHGIGLSQYGAKDLADAGIKYDVILSTYYPGTEISDYLTLK